MNGIKKLEKLKLYLTDSEILESFVKYLKTNQINKMCDEIAYEYGIEDVFESSKSTDIDIKVWYEGLSNKDRIDIDDLILSNVDTKKLSNKSVKYITDHLAEEVNVDDIIYSINSEYKVNIINKPDVYNFIFSIIINKVLNKWKSLHCFCLQFVCL